MEPTYFLYSGRLFHAAAEASLMDLNHPTHPLPTEDPGPSGPEGEHVGDEDDDDGDTDDEIQTKKKQKKEGA